jgi:hypothetical protein
MASRKKESVKVKRSKKMVTHINNAMVSHVVTPIKLAARTSEKPVVMYDIDSVQGRVYSLS